MVLYSMEGFSPRLLQTDWLTSCHRVPTPGFLSWPARSPRWWQLIHNSPSWPTNDHDPPPAWEIYVGQCWNPGPQLFSPCFHLKIPGKVASPSSSRKAFSWASSFHNRGERVPVGEDFSEQCGSWRSGFIIVPVQVITLSDKAWLDLLHQPVNRFLSLWLSIGNFRFGSRTAAVL